MFGGAAAVLRARLRLPARPDRNPSPGPAGSPSSSAFRRLRRFRFGLLGWAISFFLLLAALGLPALAVAVVAGFFVLSVLDGAFHQLKRNENVVHQLGEGGLIVHGAFEPRQQRAGLVLDPRAPDLDNAVAPRGGFAPVSLSRTISASASSSGAYCGRCRGRAAFVSGCRVRLEILGDAAHAQRAHSLGPRPLDRVEGLARLAFCRRERRMQFRVVRRDHQRDGIGIAADDRYLFARHRPARLRQPRSCHRIQARRCRTRRSWTGLRQAPASRASPPA